LFALRYYRDQKGEKGREGDRCRSESENPNERSPERERATRRKGWVNSGLWRFCNPVEAFRGERGGSVGGDGDSGGVRRGLASEQARQRRGVSRKEKAEGSRSFAGDGKRNRERPRWIERVEIDAKDGDDESERAAAVATAVTGGTKGGKGEILLTYTPTPMEVRARRDGLMRGRVRGKRNDDSG